MKRLTWMIGLLMLALSCQQDVSRETRVARPPGPGGKAVSLRILQKRLALCMPGKGCPEELFHLGSLTHLRGLVEDTQHHDWILLGQEDLRHPFLFTEDLVVALRNVWMKYPTREGNVLFYSPPGCSIDPDPDVLARLEQAAVFIWAGGSFSEVEARLGRWHATCRQPQRVRVLGIPFDLRFSEVMVAADYFMKRLADGSAVVDVEGFASLLGRMQNRVQKELLDGRTQVDTISFMNRFEFVSGKTRFLEDEGIVLIDRCPVELITEAEFLTRSGEITGTGRPDPLAEEFASSFSAPATYAQIAEKKPIYRELEGLFRSVALAKILKLKTEGAGLEYLLEEFPLGKTPVQRALVGISNIKELRHIQGNAGGHTETRLWLPSCGGVRIDPEVAPERFIQDRSLKEWATAVLTARPSPDTLSWNF